MIISISYNNYDTFNYIFDYYIFDSFRSVNRNADLI